MASFNINTFTPALNNLFREVAEAVPDIMQIIAKDAIVLIKGRIQEKGVDVNNKELPSYSPAYKKAKAARYGEASAEKTNLTATGDMFRMQDIISAGNEGGNYVVKVGGKTDFSQNKIDFNSERYGDILRTNEEEEEGFVKTFDDELQRIIDQNGFGK